MDARCAPQWVLHAHPPDQATNLSRNFWPTAARPRLPPPIRPEPCSVPSQDRVGLNDNSRAEPRRHKTTEPDEEQSVRWRDPWLGGKQALQQVQLMAQEDNLGLQPRLRLERRSQHTCSNKPKNETIPPRIPDLPVHYRVDRVFSSDKFLTSVTHPPEDYIKLD
jgi:hypothetical protein